MFLRPAGVSREISDAIDTDMPLLLRYLPLAECIFAGTAEASAAVSNPPPTS